MANLKNEENSNSWLGKADEMYDQHCALMEKGLTNGNEVVKNINISGFNIQIADKKTSEILHENLLTEVKAKRKLAEKLEAAGIPPVAILPEDIFQKIVDKAGFYTFKRITPEGKVYGDGESLNKKLHPINSIVGGRAFLLVAISAILSFFGFRAVANLLHLEYQWAIVGLFLIAGGIWFYHEIIKGENHGVVLYIFFTFLCLPLNLLFLFINKVTPKTLTEKEKKEILWPQRNDTEDVTEDLFEIVLPEPPDFVKKILTKCNTYGLDTFLVVDERAFTVIVDKKKIDELYAEWDPIICHTESKMVAVLAQFGDFPEEEAVIKYIAEHFDAARRDLLPNQVN